MKNLMVLLMIALLVALLAAPNASAQQEGKGKYYTTTQEQAPEPINGVVNAVFGQQASEEAAPTVATRSVPPWPQDSYSEQYSEEDARNNMLLRRLLSLGVIVLIALVPILIAWRLLLKR